MEEIDDLEFKQSWYRRAVTKIVSILNYKNWTSQAEISYLSILRYATLMGATLFVIAAVALFSWGLLMQFGSSQSSPEPVVLTGNDLASAIATTKTIESPETDKALPELHWRETFSTSFQSAFYDLYRKQFEPHIRQGDPKLGKSQFLDAAFPKEFVEAFSALAAVDINAKNVASGLSQRIGTNDSLKLTFFDTMNQAANNAAVKRELVAYKSAKKTQICRNVTENRQRNVDGWNSFSTSCRDWYEYPYGCPATRQVSEAVTRRQCSMQFPENLQSPLGIMKELQSQFIAQTLAKQSNSIEAAEAREAKAIVRKAQGLDAIGKAGWALMGFLAIMFLYLAIALERHHRLLVDRLDRGGAK